MNDTVNHPSHYTDCFPPIQIECIDFTKDMSFLRGNAFKYVWRAGNKNNAVEDLKKAIWYLNEIDRQCLNNGCANTQAWDYVFNKLYESVNSETECLRLRVLDLIVNSFFFEARAKTEELIKLFGEKEL